MRHRLELLGRPEIAGTVIAVAMAFAARLSLGYRSFPAIDDFVYVPIARAQFDPALYPNDLFVQGFIFHTPILSHLIRLFDATIGIAGGLMVATLCLSVATILGMYRLMRGIGADGVLLPLAVLIAAGGALNGLGRGQYDGIFGNAFHMQWLALCLLLWTYERFVRRRAVATGVLLGLTAIVHPVVGAHGAAVLFMATLLAPEGGWRRLAKTALACLVVSSPAVLPLLSGLLRSAAPVDFDIVALGYLFRTPHEFVITPMSIALFLLVVGLGWAGVLLLAGRPADPAIRCFAGLLFGQSVLAGLAIAAHGPWAEDSWIDQISLIYRVVLTRTTPVLLALCAVVFAAAAERHLRRGKPSDRSIAARAVFWTCAGFALFLVMIQVSWSPVFAIAALLMAATAFVWPVSQLRAAAAAAWAAVGLTCVGLLAFQTDLEAPVPAEEAELYAWVRDSTPREAVFIVPPGFQEFRLYAERSAYVDFKTFPATTAALIPEWRRRLEQVAAPDRLALDAVGWPGVAQWDRTYGNRNTPGRIADLLGETGSDYFVWDSDALDIPPFTPVNRVKDARLATAYSNARFTVYRLVDGGSGQTE